MATSGPVPADLPGEEWRPVRELPDDYQVSNLGRVRRISPHGGRGGSISYPGRLIATSSWGSRRRARMIAQGRVILRSVNRLVAEAFLSPPPSGDAVVVNLNGDVGDSRAVNLAWRTPKQVNAATGARRRKLAPAQAAEIRVNPHGETVRQLVARMGVGRSTVHKIQRGLAYNEN
jgi:NUMOD4 motif